MRRREFIAGLGSAAAWPLVAHAQGQNPIPVVGFLSGNWSRFARTSQVLSRGDED